MIYTENPGPRESRGSPNHRGADPEPECAGIRSPDSAFDPAAVRSWVRGPRLARYLADVLLYRRAAFAPAVRRVRYVRIAEADRARIGCFPIAVLCRPAQEVPEPPTDGGTAAARVVWLTPETAVKQVIHHDDLTAAAYRVLPEIVEHGEVFERDSGRLLTFFDEDEDGCLYRTVIKQAPDGACLLATFHRARMRDWRAARRNMPKNTA